jgi:hypothetical protein
MERLVYIEIRIPRMHAHIQTKKQSHEDMENVTICNPRREASGEINLAATFQKFFSDI